MTCTLRVRRHGRRRAVLLRRRVLREGPRLHDVGRLVIGQLYGDEFGDEPHAETPEERVRRERRELGIDHALVGSVLVRRWGLRAQIGAWIELQLDRRQATKSLGVKAAEGHPALEAHRHHDVARAGRARRSH